MPDLTKDSYVNCNLVASRENFKVWLAQMDEAPEAKTYVVLGLTFNL